MGRKKIQIQRITDERNRQVTFTKRKFGLMKKAYELSVLCDCEIALIIFNHSNKLFQYASTDMDKVLLKYTEYNEPHESRTNADIIETLRKKGFNGCDSPEPDGDDSIDQSSLNEDKYCKASEDLDILFKRYGSAVPPPTFSMPVTVPVSNQNALQFTTGGPLVTTSFAPSSLSDPRLLSPQQSALQRNTVSPGLPQRPASAGALLGGDLNSSNGACPSPVGNGYISARASPGLSVSNGNSLGKIAPAKSPPPPSSQMGINSRKPDLRVITPSKGLIQLNAQRLGVSQVTQPLTTPVVSVATPSLLTQGLPFSAMPTAYNAEYQLTSADLSALQAFSSPSSLSLGNISTWQQQQAQQQATQQHQQLSLASLSNLVPSCHLPQNTSLTVNINPVSIKSEPVSPNRDRSTPCSSATGSGLGGTQYLRQDPTGRSPVDSLSSNGSSYEGSDRDDPGQQQRPQDFGCSLSVVRPSGDTDQDNSGVKRKRLDAWVT
ncbi:myocyte-specific enhancer factor 2D isoform X1 [Erpetoichthys calabaricus]|uniref:Myocyte enhancer factor 2d n=1 Tax=Erpetoichthys calabaricus TaxID=27687 RepID=A0A8C4RF24_ERPCA|nr:myocyte-specific enhancer factor 2D isoform X1 [Erpetoichthys calabaricus]XP_051779266.1 myocyte-specific enhancer factor 2D isoform X1 [Erpetoichthys calabaricus]XP_051779267.1 myocyte-specific enhancer factor 2D isoform X1 [Erpetoichthys calabaricus]